MAAALPASSVPSPLPAGMTHFPSWKVSPVVLCLPHRGFYAEDSTCKPCSSPCRTCEGNATNCHSCQGSLTLHQGACREACPERHVAVEGVCKACPEMCQDCIHEKTCKGMWEHPRGVWLSQATAPGDRLWGWGRRCPCKMEGTSLLTFTEIDPPPCPSLRKSRL